VSNTIAWIGGAGQGLTWGAAFNASDLSSLANSNAVLSSAADIANGTALDLYADVAVEIAIPSTTLAVGAAIYLFLFDEFKIDGTNSYYGDNSLVAGTAKAYLPTYGLVGTVTPTITGAAQTVVTGAVRGILLPPRSFRFVLGNALGVTLDASGTADSYVSYTTYKLNDNA
jgi:hypothetical protein